MSKESKSKDDDATNFEIDEFLETDNLNMDHLILENISYQNGLRFIPIR